MGLAELALVITVIAGVLAILAYLFGAFRWMRERVKPPRERSAPPGVATPAPPVRLHTAQPTASRPPEPPGSLTATGVTTASCAGQYDVFLSYSHVDADLVEQLASRLEDEGKFRVWLDKWVLVAGESWQQAISKGLDEAKCCAACYGEGPDGGWFRQEIERALNRQAAERGFRVIPVLLPSAKEVNVDSFLKLRTWVDFRDGFDDEWEFHVLVCGIKGLAPGRAPRVRPGPPETVPGHVWRGLAQLRELRAGKLIDYSVYVEYQRRLCDTMIEGGGNDG